MTHPTRLGLLVLFVALTLAPPPARAFFQKTTVEGVVGADIGGVWLAVHHVMPTFRVRLDRAQETVAPFKVGPITDDLALLMGDDVAGVVVTEFYDPSAAAVLGVFPGDVITKLNVFEIVDVASFDKALEEVKSWFLITVRRPRLQFSSARLVKIDYQATETEVDGVSEIGAERIKFTVSDAVLPFAKAIDDARKAKQLYVPRAEEVAALETAWHELPGPDKPVYISGEHRIVAQSNYDAALRKDDSLEGTQFAIISQLAGNPLAGVTGKTISIYGARDVSGQTIRGTYVESTLASAPFPISIEFGGTFTLTKLDDSSNKDIDYRTAQREAEAGEEEEEEEDVELAPDVPENVEPETD